MDLTRIFVFLCPVLCLLLLAIVIGPVTATRYRFVMHPFLAILAAFALSEFPRTKFPTQLGIACHDS